MVSALLSSLTPKMVGLPDAVWRADQLGSSYSNVIPTGYAALDKELPGKGWPCSALIELLLPQLGIGELRLLATSLAPLTHSGKTLILLAAPHIPFAPALHQLGFNLKNVLLINADKATDRVWAMEQALKSGSCGALLAWLPQVKTEHLRRLQLAAAGGEGMVFVFRPVTAKEQSSPAPLRLSCHAAPAGKLAVEIFKRRGPAHADSIILSLPLPKPLIKPFAVRNSRVSTFNFPSHAVDSHTLAATPARRHIAFPV